MDFLSNNASSINWIAVILATLSTLPVGFVWYSLKVFGARWAKEAGVSKEQMESTDGMLKTFGMMLFISLLTAIVLSAMMRALEVNGIGNALIFGLVVGVVLRGGAHIIHNGFSKKSDLLTLINLGHDAVSIVVMTVILAAIV